MTAPPPCTCPTCGQPMAEVPVGALGAMCSPTMRRVVEVVARRPGISGQALADAVYAERVDGGPENAPGVLRVQISKWNRRLASSGWRVSGEGRGSRGYHLVRL